MKRILSILLVMALLTGTAYALTCEKALFPVFVNGQELQLSDPPIAVNGKSYLPVKAVAGAVGVDATWKNNRVEITTLDIEKLKDSCVMVRGGDVKGTYTEQASGVIIDYDEILTVNHVTDHTYFAIHYDDSTAFIHCSLTDTSTSEDAAILTPENRDVKPVPIGDSDTVKAGDTVYIVSSPGSEKNVISTGKVTGTSYTDPDNIFIFNVSSTSKPGASGGACFNSGGELIGMVIGAANSDSSSCVVPINDIRKNLAA